MSTTTTTATNRTMEVIQSCVNTLHDLAAESPWAAAEVLAALRDFDSPAANLLANHIARVTEARHGAAQLRRAEYQ
jgi:hypothetical protein